MEILLADPDRALRRRLRRLLGRLLDVRIVGEASTGRGAVRLAKKGRPAVVLLGSTLRNPACLETVRVLKTIRARTQVIIHTVRHTKAYVRTARRLGAHYCLPVRTLEVRLPSLVGLAYRDYLAAARRRRRSRSSRSRR